VLSCMYLKDWLTIEKLRVKFGISLEWKYLYTCVLLSTFFFIQLFFRMKQFFLIPFLGLGWKKFIFSHPQYQKTKIHTTLIYKKQLFLHPIPIVLDETIPTQKKKNKDHCLICLTYSLFLSLFYIFKPLLFFWGGVHFFHPQQVDIPFSFIQLVGWNKFVLQMSED
jgi:hypothetical protein